MSRITTHVLDTAAGVPAAAVPVSLEVQAGDEWLLLAETATDADGRACLLLQEDAMEQGIYRATFDVATYFAARATESFYPGVTVLFNVSGAEHYHVPLLLSPFGYSTYRGS